MNPAAIRRLRPGGDEALLRGACALLRDGEEASAERCAAMLADPRAYVFVATIDGAVVGWIIGFRLPRWSGDKMFLYEIDVAEPYRRRGIAAALIDTLWAVCRDEGLISMFVITEEANAAAMKLYESTGARRPHRDDVMWAWWED